MLYQRILRAIDGSATSDRTLDHATRLAGDTGAELPVVHVAESPLAATMLSGEYTSVTAAG